MTATSPARNPEYKALLTAAASDPLARLALADWCEERGLADHARTHRTIAGQTTPAGTERVTVGRAGANMARCGNGISVPVWRTKVYRAVRRPDGLLTWRLVRWLRDDTAGSGKTGPMWERAEAYAAAHGLTVATHITHGTVCS